MKIIDFCVHERIPQSRVKDPHRNVCSICYVSIIMQEVCSFSFACVQVSLLRENNGQINHNEGFVLVQRGKAVRLSGSKQPDGDSRSLSSGQVPQALHH